MVLIATNAPTGCGHQSPGMSREAVSNLKSVQWGRDLPRWGGFMRFEDAAVDGRCAQIPLKKAIKY